MDGKQIRGNRRRWLTMVVLLSLGMNVSAPLPAAAQTREMISSNGKEMFDVAYFDLGENWRSDLPVVEKSTYTLSAVLKSATNAGIQYWSDILSAGAKNTVPIQIFVRAQMAGSNNPAKVYGNAGAAALACIDGEGISSNYIANSIQQNARLIQLDPGNPQQDISSGTMALGLITVGQFLSGARVGSEYGWYIDTDTVLPTNEQANDYVATIRHEMGHALGISARKGSGTMPGLSQEVYGFVGDVTSANSWNLHLYDQNGNQARPGMAILTTEQFNTLKAQDASVKRSDYFILDNEVVAGTTTGQAYFKGTHVSEVLDGSTFDGVDGLPVNGRESGVPELSHLNTLGMMSHVTYSNYTSFMEAELAVMQDLGYTIDRKNYYGYSVYGDNITRTNRNGYSARNSDGTAYEAGVYNTTALGIGLHVYGSYNNITQAANILTTGTGAVGMRIDGTGNTITEASGTEIHADGYRGIGTLISYGSNQVLNQQGVITADGSGGNGVQFDFGSSSLGATDEYRGSYIRYIRTIESQLQPTSGYTTGAITGGQNISITEPTAKTDDIRRTRYDAHAELNGPLVKAYNIGGRLSGAANAIYIGKNAFVQDINVNNGASINGNITSEWKHFATDEKIYDGVKGDGSDALKIQYNGGSYAYNDYIQNLVTNLNFNTNIAYSGNITGSDNMKINVQSGTLAYSGTANVVNVDVSAGASLIGGTYILNDMTSRMAAGFSDTTTGQLINHGAIVPGSTDMTVNGNLTSDGQLGIATTNNGSIARQIVISGTANIDGSKLVTAEGNAYRSDQNYTFLTAKAINGSLTSKAGDAFSGLLSIKAVDMGTTSVSAVLTPENNK